MRWSFDLDRKACIFTGARRSPLQDGFRWSFPRPEGLGCSVKPLRGSLKIDLCTKIRVKTLD